MGRHALGAAIALGVLAAVGVAPAPATLAAPPRAQVIGHSVGGRALRLVRVGDPHAAHRVLVVGCVHGDERAGMAVTRALRTATPPAGVELLLLDTANPDRCTGPVAARGNAHGVDLNRNFPSGWRPLGGVYDSGPRPSSEPETRAIEALVARERPEASIWFHQHLDLVDLQRGSSRLLMRSFAAVAGMRTGRLDVLPGTAVRWQNQAVPGSSAFVVELPAGAQSAAGAQRRARAVLAVAALLPPLWSGARTLP